MRLVFADDNDKHDVILI